MSLDWTKVLVAFIAIIPALLSYFGVIGKLSKRLDRIEKDLGSARADAARRRILNFDKEIRRGEKHTEEDYADVSKDIDVYDGFCRINPDYPNNRAVTSEKHVKDTYQKALANNDFL